MGLIYIDYTEKNKISKQMFFYQHPLYKTLENGIGNIGKWNQKHWKMELETLENAFGDCHWKIETLQIWPIFSWQNVDQKCIKIVNCSGFFQG